MSCLVRCDRGTRELLCAAPEPSPSLLLQAPARLLTELVQPVHLVLSALLE